MQNYDHFMDMRHLHGSGVNPKSKLELDPHILKADIIEVFGVAGKYKTTNESCIHKAWKIWLEYVS